MSTATSFIVEFYVSRVYLPRGNTVGSHSTTIHSRNHLVLETTSWSTISRMLSQVEVPFHVQPAMIAKIYEAAKAISARNTDRKILLLVVRITLLVRGYEGKELDPVDGECCAICLDTIKAGPRHVRTPCEHVYHRECIVGWLKRRNSCPLCRLQLPESSSSFLFGEFDFI